MAKKKNTKSRRIWSWVKFIFKLFILLTLLTLVVLGILFYLRYGKTIFKWQDEAKELVSKSTADTFRQSETSLVYDKNEKIMSVLKGIKDVYYIGYEDIPDDAKKAMISIEDKKFMQHNGVDLKANVRAVWQLIKHKGKITQGASTITQQLSRNIFLTNEVSYERKIKEMFIAMELEKKYSKNQILEFYLNNAYFANGYYGIEAASKGYFNKSAKNLSLSQIAFLCAIPNSPTMYDPVDYPENTIKRRNRILDQMCEDGKISQSELNDAKREKIKLERKAIEKKNYIDTYVNYCAVRALMQEQGFKFKTRFSSDKKKKQYEKEYSEAYNECQQSLYKSGYRIYTSIDMDIQKKLQKSIDDQLKIFPNKTKKGLYEMQGAGTCIDNKNGRVVAIVGGRSQKSEGYTLNRAYQSFRQPGSSIKPLIVYTPAFMQGYTPEQYVEDKKVKDGPSNSNGRYSGKMTLRSAIEQSKNTVAWQIYDAITPATGLSYLLEMGFSKIVDSDYGLGSGLGGLTNGVSTVEMASGYATLENDGIYRAPTCIVKIMDSKGNEIVGDHVNEQQVYETNAARTMTDVLTGVFKNGTGRGLGIPNMSCAGKTGTTNDNKDGWLAGYTPYYTTSIWVGCDTPKTIPSLMGNTYPGKIWNEFMTMIHEGLENKAFPSYVGRRPAKTLPPTPDNTEPTKEPDKTPDTSGTPSAEPSDKPVKTPTPTPAPSIDEPVGGDDKPTEGDDPEGGEGDYPKDNTGNEGDEPNPDIPEEE